MTIEQDMQSEIDAIKSKVATAEAELKKKKKEVISLKKELNNKIKAKALFLGEKIPKQKKKKSVEEVKK
ncbi:MAG: hypothetical protein WDA74_11175 [Spirochaetota bacterium]